MAKEKAIIEGLEELKSRYFNSHVYRGLKNQGDSVKFAVDQKYMQNEQMTRHGFYLATLAALYDTTLESFTQIYSSAEPMFIFNSKRLQGEGFAERAQWFLNRTWENMGPANMGGIHQWLALTRDVPIFSCAIAHPRWARRSGVVEKPIIKSGGFVGEMLEWTEENDYILDEPEIVRIHPYDWFGEHYKGENLSYEGFIEKWSASDVAQILDDEDLNPEEGWRMEELKKLYEDLKKGKTEQDPYYYEETSSEGTGGYKNKRAMGNGEYTNTRETTITSIWTTVNHIKGLENDPNEYHIIYDSNRIYKASINKIRGFRQILRVRSNPVNDHPFGRSLLAPSLPHNKIMNLGVNLALDETFTRIHNGYAIWPHAMTNPNEFLNPQGVNGFVRMKKEAKKEQIPFKIHDQRSGTLDDILTLNQVIHQDSERMGKPDQSYGLTGTRDETATGRMILEQADNRRTRNAVINMSYTGLIPIGKQINLMALRNTPEVERQELSYDGNTFAVDNQMLVEIWNNNHATLHDSIMRDQNTEASRLSDFLSVAAEVLLKHPGGLAPMTNLIRDYGRKRNIANVERYFPESLAPQVDTQENTTQPTQESGGTLSPPMAGPDSSEMTSTLNNEPGPPLEQPELEGQLV